MKLQKIMIYIFGSLSLLAANSIQAEEANIQDEILSQATTLNPTALNISLKAYSCAVKQGLTKKPILTIIDFSKPSSQKRLWVIDLQHKKIDFTEYVTHGQNSGVTQSTKFSNRSGSHESSIGVFLTQQQPYYGHVGIALRIRGLDKGFNDNALRRAVVLHGANYATESFIKTNGRLGRSWGCPAIDPKLIKPTINTIKGGSILVAYYPDEQWLSNSQYLHCT